MLTSNPYQTRNHTEINVVFLERQIARRLSLVNHPQCSALSGGQAIELLAKDGDRKRFPFRTPMGKTYDCCFSFAGLRNQVTKTIDKLEVEEGTITPATQTVTDFLGGWKSHSGPCL